ncbi:MAG TPA: protein translocase subunit SecD [Candidatus Paceibacterota bacterium]
MFQRRFFAVVLILFGLLLAYFDGYSFLASANPEAWFYRPFKLGLDLRGGSHLIYQADTSTLPATADIGEAMSSLKEVIERRVNAFGVGEPLIQVEQVGVGSAGAHRLIVELPGVTDLQEALKVIDVTPILEFRIERPEGPEKAAITKAYEDARAKYEAGEPISNDPLLAQDPEFVPSELTGRYLKRAQVDFTGQTIGPTISVEFDKTGGDIFAKITKENVEKRIGIYLDGQLLSAPVVREEIKDGKAQISGDFTVEEARTLVRNLNLGALPVPIKLISTETIGATLGQEALDRGVRAGVIGLLLVAVFMILWYRASGVLAVLSLGIYVSLMLAIFKILPVTLTAAGMAGFILSVGMAVDANILIFARLKEEMRHTDNMHDAISHGFTRAWASIRDSNLSSIISALILFWFGTSLVRGFALTLAIGVLISMLTAISITRTFLLAIGVTRTNRLNRFFFGSGIRH